QPLQPDRGHRDFPKLREVSVLDIPIERQTFVNSHRPRLVSQGCVLVVDGFAVYEGATAELLRGVELLMTALVVQQGRNPEMVEERDVGAQRNLPSRERAPDKLTRLSYFDFID